VICSVRELADTTAVDCTIMIPGWLWLHLL
jgi:hypothetical protein